MLRVGADAVRRLDQFLRDLAVDARRADIEAGGEEEAAALEIELDLGVHRHLVRELDLPPARGVDRPATIKADIPVDKPFPRHRGDPDLVAKRHEILNLLGFEAAW